MRSTVAVERLHGRVSEERQLVRRLQPVAGGEALDDIADRLGDHTVLFAGRAQVLPDVVRVDARMRAFVPLYDQRIEALLGGPHVIADHRDDVVEHDDVAHAGNLPGGAVVDLPTLPPNTGQALRVANFMPGSIASMP